MSHHGERALERAERAARRAAEIGIRIEALRRRRQRLAGMAMSSPDGAAAPSAATSTPSDVLVARRAAAQAVADAIEAHRHSATAHRDSALVHRDAAEMLARHGQHDRAAQWARAAVVAERVAADADAAAVHTAGIWTHVISAAATLGRGTLARDARALPSAVGDEGRVTGPASAGSRGP